MHHFRITTTWTGNTGSGTSSYRAYSRNHELCEAGKAASIPGSSQAAYRGDATRYNPEELLMGAASACHMLWMLHLCADAGIVVVSYTDEATGTMSENADGSGQFDEVVLHPTITITDLSRSADIDRLHEQAHKVCCIARSVNFPVRIEGRVEAVASCSV
jgi:organic hydroperoxide reductase OsmC/OhrA